VTMKNAIFRDVMPCGSCKNRHFGGSWFLHQQGDKNRLQVTTNVPSSLILVTLMMQALRSSKRSVLTRVTRHNIPEDSILQFITCLFLWWGVVSPTPKPQSWKPTPCQQSTVAYSLHSQLLSIVWGCFLLHLHHENAPICSDKGPI
jgi:cytochrome c oxidase assembly factor CtaG